MASQAALDFLLCSQLGDIIIKTIVKFLISHITAVRSISSNTKLSIK